MSDIIVPALGESVSEATILKWYKKPGDAVKMDELLLELETEKVTLEVNAMNAGVFETVIKNEGEVVKIGEVVGRITDGAIATTQAPVAEKANAVTEVPKLNPAESLPPSVQKIVTENK